MMMIMTRSKIIIVMMTMMMRILMTVVTMKTMMISNIEDEYDGNEMIMRIKRA